MLRNGVMRVAALAQAQRTIGGGIAAETKAWISSGKGGNEDNPTPAETKLAFESTDYGKDPASGAELTPAQIAAAEQLKKRAAVSPTSSAATAFPKGNDPRAMFDSLLSQQADDGKASDTIKREVASDTPDTTRVTFRASAYGKDPQAGAALSEKDAAEIEAMRGRLTKSPAGAAPVHDSRNMFDSDLTQGGGSAPAADSIKRDVVADTPDATRVVFRASAYGKDPQNAAVLSDQDLAEVEAMQNKLSKAAAAAAPIHDKRNMFDSDLTQSAGSTRPADSIKRDVATDTPDGTRVAFRAMDYGKDPHAARELPREEAAEVEAMKRRVCKASADTAPVHDSRSMFDSDLVHGAGSTPLSDSIKRKVSADTPEETRLVFGGSDYGKDPALMAHSAEKQAEIDALAAKAMRRAAADRAGSVAPIHHPRSMFDSDLTQGAGMVRGSDAINREVAAGTPEVTRLAFGGSDYGKDPRSMQRTTEEQAAMDDLAVRAKVAAARFSKAPVHHERSMFDSVLTQGGNSIKDSAGIKREVVADTPELTRLSFFGSTYGDSAQSEESAAKSATLARKQKKGQKLASAGRGARGSNVHDTKRAMQDDEYSQAGAE